MKQEKIITEVGGWKTTQNGGHYVLGVPKKLVDEISLESGERFFIGYDKETEQIIFERRKKE